MAKNSGKRFEENFKKSISNDLFCYRFKDGTANFTGTKNENVRFQAHNVCDFMVFNGQRLFLLELKAHKGKSLPLNCIRDNQIKELSKASMYTNIVTGILVYFADLEEVYFLEIDKLILFMGTEDRKSIPIDYFRNEGNKIPIVKAKTNILMNLHKIFD